MHLKSEKNAFDLESVPCAAAATVAVHFRRTIELKLILFLFLFCHLKNLCLPRPSYLKCKWYQQMNEQKMTVSFWIVDVLNSKLWFLHANQRTWIQWIQIKTKLNMLCSLNLCMDNLPLENNQNISNLLAFHLWILTAIYFRQLELFLLVIYYRI